MSSDESLSDESLSDEAESYHEDARSSRYSYSDERSQNDHDSYSEEDEPSDEDYRHDHHAVSTTKELLKIILPRKAAKYGDRILYRTGHLEFDMRQHNFRDRAYQIMEHRSFFLPSKAAYENRTSF